MISNSDMIKWLDTHGKDTTGGYDDFNGHFYITWRTHNGMPFQGTGIGVDEMHENLFHIIKETLWARCEIGVRP